MAYVCCSTFMAVRLYKSSALAKNVNPRLVAANAQTMAAE